MNQAKTEASITLRRATSDDMMLYFEWANDPDVRKNSFSQEPIALDAHRSWFAKKLSDDNAALYVMEVGGIAAGQIRFDMVAEEVNERLAEIDFSLDHKFRGQGFGATILTLGVKAFIRDTPKPIMIQGSVKNANIASRRAFFNAGFTELLQADDREATRYHYHAII
jgi:UDP-2,4-diacetamido-2,4,6-trideoxy-beta-L-altropyranose hydrolase